MCCKTADWKREVVPDHKVRLPRPQQRHVLTDDLRSLTSSTLATLEIRDVACV